jgi:hypothetical protein
MMNDDINQSMLFEGWFLMQETDLLVGRKASRVLFGLFLQKMVMTPGNLFVLSECSVSAFDTSCLRSFQTI